MPKPCANSVDDLPKPSFLPGASFSMRTVAADSQGVLWVIDPETGIVRQVITQWPAKSGEVIGVGQRTYREIKKDCKV